MANESMPLKPQVEKSHYHFSFYDNPGRWLAYFHQIRAVVRVKPQSLLELGMGNGTVRDYLVRAGLEVTSLDFDANLKPDVVADVRDIDRHFERKSFDAVCAYQILEHIPYSDFEPTLRKIGEIAREHVLISLPHAGTTFFVRFGLRKWRWSFGRRMSLGRPWAFDGEHHWELGSRGHSIRQVRKTIEKVFDLESAYFCPEFPYHYFFVCAVRKSEQ